MTESQRKAPDREKVIRHFQDAISASGAGHRWRFVHADIIEDAIALLREQEPVEPRWFTDVHHPAGAFVCGACRERIVEKNFDFYCPKCGKAVKWDA